MSAFNTVVVPGEACPRCGNLIDRRVQFKHGDCRAHEYVVGDTVRWGGNDVGAQAPLVTVDGYPEPCPDCGFDLDRVYDVVVRDDVIASVTPGGGADHPGRGH